MKKAAYYSIIALLLASCATTDPLSMEVSPLGETIPETTAGLSYSLPRSVVKVEISYRETRHVPGPFRDYAEKYLSINELIKQNYSTWQLVDVQLSTHSEMDPEMHYQVMIREGEFDQGLMSDFISRGLILDDSEMLNKQLRGSELEAVRANDYMRFEDLGIESNFEQRSETMYKTIVTDTSFVEVPVSRTITEQKSLSTKAKEAADFILELRTRRFELLTGEYEGYPQGVAMQATLDKLDELERSYLELFTGRTLSKTAKKSWFVVPESGSQESRVQLALFSKQLGFVPEEMGEGQPIFLHLKPLGLTAQLAAYHESGETDSENRLIYRVPDVVQVDLIHGENKISRSRISIYQSGALVSQPLN